MRPDRSWRVGFTAALLALTLAGCSGSYSDEMREQERVMASETAEWSRQLPRWEKDLSDQSSWLARHPERSVDVSQGEAYRQYEERLSKHEEDVAHYRQELVSHRAALRKEDSESEDVRTETHDAIWTEHQKLKASFAMLRNQHEDLMKEHSEMLAAGDMNHRNGARR